MENRGSLKTSSLLFVAHSSESTGGGEDDFLRLLKFFYSKNNYKILIAIPEGPRTAEFQKYSDQSVILRNNIFPFEKFSVKGYSKFFLKSLLNIRKIFKFIRGENVRSAFLNSSVCFMESLPMVFRKIPFVVSIKERIDPALVRKIIYRFLQKKACKVVVISNFLKTLFLQNVKNGTCELIYSSFNSNDIEAAKILNERSIKEKNKFEIVNVGVISYNKGQHMLIDAVDKIRSENVVVKFIGRVTDEKYYESLKHKVEKSPFPQNYLFCGEMKHDKVLNEMLNSDCVVVSSLQEGMSLVILEALALGVPLVTSNVGIASEIIKDGVNGFTFSPGDSNRLYQKITQFIDGNINLNVLTSNAIETGKKFDLNKSLELYEEVILSCN